MTRGRRVMESRLRSHRATEWLDEPTEEPGGVAPPAFAFLGLTVESQGNDGSPCGDWLTWW